MGYIVENQTKGSVLYPASLEEALVHFLDAEIPLEHGGDLAEKFFNSLVKAGLSEEAVAAVRSIQLPCPRNGRTVEF